LYAPACAAAVAEDVGAGVIAVVLAAVPLRDTVTVQDEHAT
jgi:hypothetical protein